MDREELARKIVEMAAEEGGVEPATVSPASHFQDDLKYDSLSTVEFAMALEEEFEIAIPDEDIETLRPLATSSTTCKSGRNRPRRARRERRRSTAGRGQIRRVRIVLRT
jgi:acyl carrier protein